MTKLSLMSEFSWSCMLLEYRRSNVTVVEEPGGKELFTFWTSFSEASKLSHSVGLPKIIGKLLKVVVGFSFTSNELQAAHIGT